MQHQIHHLHRHDPEQGLVTQHQGGEVAIAVSKTDAQWANHRDVTAGTISQHDFACAGFLQVETKLDGDVLRHGEEYRAGIHQGTNVHAVLGEAVLKADFAVRHF